MKKTLFISAILLAVTTGSFAQSDYDEAAFVQGQSTVSAGYGFANVWKKLFKLSAEFTEGTYKITATGPFSLTYEYGFTDRLSGGVAVSYSKVNANYTDPEPKLNSTESLTNFSAIGRVNYHFGSSAKFDPYIGAGIGYHHFKYVYKTASDNESNAAFQIPGTLGYTVQLGAKYYFSPAISAFAEVGYVAGGLAQAGIAARF